MMHKMLRIASLLLLIPIMAVAFVIPKAAFGPYIGAYLMDCTTINNQVLCVTGDPSLGVAPLLGADLKFFLPGNYFSEIGLGYSPQRTEAGNFSSSTSSTVPRDTVHTSGKLTIIPLTLTLGRDFQLMPKLWGTIGLSAGYTWARVEIDTTAIYSGGIFYDSHTVGKGGNPFVGFKTGIDLYVHRRVDISISFGYRFGNIDDLTVKESDTAERVGSTLTYFDRAANTDRPLPLEISNALLCYAVKYRF